MRNISVIVLMFFMAIWVSMAQAEPKTITLKDGSQIKGEILSLTDGAYTLKTEALGQITIRDKDIVSITTGIPASKAPGAAELSPDSRQMQSQVIRLQSALMGDPGMMHEIVQLLEDPEIKRLLNDPQLMNDILSYDPAKIQENQNARQLMNNTNFQRLMETITEKFSPGERPADRK